MLEAYGDIWNNVQNYQAVVITTNGFVKKNGEAVMGRGIALEAKNRYPWLPKELGKDLKKGNNVYTFLVSQYDEGFGFDVIKAPWVIITFPVKPQYGPHFKPGWMSRAEIPLIEKSARELKEYIDNTKLSTVLMPRPGCGNGGLKWEDVKPIIEPILDDRFTVMHNPAFV